MNQDFLYSRKCRNLMRWAFRELKNKIVVVIITPIIKADKQKTRQPLEKTNLTATSKCNLILPLS